MVLTWLKKVTGRAKHAARGDRRPQSRWQRVPLRLELLEDRSLLTTWTVGGATPNFVTIQAANDSPLVLNGDTLALRPVTFVVDPTTPHGVGDYGNLITKSLTIEEDPAIAGTATIAPPASGTLADTKDNSSFGGTSISGFIVAASGVTFTSSSSHRIVVDGQANGNATSNFRNGIITDFRGSSGITSAVFNSLSVSGVTVQNILRRGIQVSTNGTGNSITSNTVNNVQGANTGGTPDVAAGIGVFGGDTTVTGNTVSNSVIGIAANDDVTDPNPQHPLVTIKSNTLTNNQVGVNVAALSNGSAIGDTAGGANTITTGGGSTGSNGFADGFGIVVAFSGTFGGTGGGPSTVSVSGNTINATNNDSGIRLYNNLTPVQVSSNSITLTSPGSTNTDGSKTGIYLFDSTALSGNNGTGPNNATIIKNTITGFLRGIDLNTTDGQIITATIGDSAAGDANILKSNNAALSVGIRSNVASGAGVPLANIGLNTFTTGPASGTSNAFQTGVLVNGGAQATFTAATTVFGSKIGLEIDGPSTSNNSTVTVNAPGVTLNTNFPLTGLKLFNGTINGTNTLRSNGIFDMEAGTVNVGLDGPADSPTVNADFKKQLSSGTVTLGPGVIDTYKGITNISDGILTQNGTFDFETTPINLTANSVTLNGTGTDAGRNVIVKGNTSSDTIQGLTFNNFIGDAIDVNTGAAKVLIGGTGTHQGVTITGSNGTTGILLELGSTASVIGTAGTANTEPGTIITGNSYGIDVYGAVALIAGVDLSTNNVGAGDGLSGPAGLRARTGVDATTDATVDAGQVGGGVDFTSLGTGTLNTPAGGSTGGNWFKGYTDYTTDPNNPVVPTVPQAIVDLNNNFPNSNKGPQGVPYDLQAQDAFFGDGGGNISQTNYAQIEQVVYHDHDDSTIGFVNFLEPSGANPSVIAGYPRFYAVNPDRNPQSGVTGQFENEDPTYNQRSNIVYLRLAFDNVVFVQNANSSGLNGGIQLFKAPANTDPANPANSSGVYNANTNPHGTQLSGGNATGTSTTGQIGIKVYSTEFDPANTGHWFVDLELVGTKGAGALEVSGSLVDGIYKLLLNPSGISTGNVNASPPATGATLNPADTTDYFHRLYGDTNGSSGSPNFTDQPGTPADGLVDTQEQTNISNLANANSGAGTNFGSPNYKFYLDFDLQNTIDNDSKVAVASRVGKYNNDPLKNNPGFNAEPYPTF